MTRERPGPPDMAPSSSGGADPARPDHTTQHPRISANAPGVSVDATDTPGNVGPVAVATYVLGTAAPTAPVHTGPASPGSAT